MAEKLGLPASSTYAGWESEYKKPFLPFDRAQAIAMVLDGLGEPAITKSEVLALSGVTRAEPRRAEPRETPAASVRIPEYDVRPQAGADGEVGEMHENGVHAVHAVKAEWMWR